MSLQVLEFTDAAVTQLCGRRVGLPSRPRLQGTTQSVKAGWAH